MKTERIDITMKYELNSCIFYRMNKNKSVALVSILLLLWLVHGQPIKKAKSFIINKDIKEMQSLVNVEVYSRLQFTIVYYSEKKY